MNDTTRQTLHLVIHGKVQGVFYRDSMRRQAETLRVDGWVRNRTDGTVEALVQGTPETVEAILHWAQRGPEQARVDRVDAAPGNGDYRGFDILY